MREIKFRMWDGENMSFPCNIGDIIGGHLDFYEEGSTVVMQFTGLKDKNGKEIYEGDVCQWGRRFVVEMEDTGCGCHNGHGWPFSSDETKDIEVIGDIYENPELMNNGENV